MPQAVDYSWARPDPAAIAAAGYVGALRYAAPDDGANTGKILRAAELVALHAARLDVGLVWETTGNRALAGADAGRADALACNAFADALGWPADRPLYFADESYAPWTTVAPYWLAVAAASRRPWGAYGPYALVEALAGRTPYLWQSAAAAGFVDVVGEGSGGSIASPADGGRRRRLSRHAVLYQHVGAALGGTCDANEVLATDWGQWAHDHQENDVLNDDDRAWLTKTVREQVADLLRPVELDTGSARYLWGLAAPIPAEDAQLQHVKDRLGEPTRFVVDPAFVAQLRAIPSSGNPDVDAAALLDALPKATVDALVARLTGRG